MTISVSSKPPRAPLCWTRLIDVINKPMVIWPAVHIIVIFGLWSFETRNSIPCLYINVIFITNSPSLWFLRRVLCVYHSEHFFFFNVAFTKLGSNLYHEFPSFKDSQGEPFENIVGKEENAGNQHFLLFPQRFLLFSKQISTFELHSFCCLQMLSIYISPKVCLLIKN